MIRYHMNQATGEPGLCSAKPGNCPFGGDEAHFTSPEAARKDFEKAQATFPDKKWTPTTTALDITDALAKTPLLEAGEKFSAAEDKPVGSLLIRLHHESDDSTYLIKAEDGKWYPIVRNSHFIYSLARSATPKENMEHSGSIGYYFPKPSESFAKKLSKVAKEDRAAAVAKIGKFVHNSVKYDYAEFSDIRVPYGNRSSEGIKELSTTKYEELPLSAKEYYSNLANGAIDALEAYQQNPEDVGVVNRLFENISETYLDDEEITKANRGQLKEILTSAGWVVKTWN